MGYEDADSVGIGRLVTGWRKRAFLSQTALADALGTQQATVSKLETGSYKLSVRQLACILNACGLSFADVADELDATLHMEARPIWERVHE
ncbi:helix-turn-helix transcriptional regulator [Paratractidigestivibacter sp.]|uniref:helix-turn-helix domain-containing protein n=1 Tax=Paratractidigestivibacter sp. TaxID=2847316 RepID=UPI002ACB1092|nr:helix-turn-helix transcriptional regulator [Paratractidigestivibacter sp.]